MESGTSKSKVKRHVGKYELGRTIGEGTFAKVRFAKNIETGEPVAIKILDKEKVLKHKLVEQVFVFICVIPNLMTDNTKYKVIALSVFSDCIITPLTSERSVCLSCQNPFRYEGDELAGVHNAQDKPSHSLLSKLAGDKPSHSLLSEIVPGDKPSHSRLTMQAHLRPFITCRQKFLGIDITIRALFGMKIYTFCCLK
ncbi:hypothetical protein ZIOFF_056965 [Zingiber officinale]|uniref:Non-specific serine/threonine protein kinase n=1 Tax=Zingiber officinale TaxID=94328 RepID=A0A8J5FIT5_ZINOF|nr:hypothetical protein ZIOFF_056965 [Zingiber officinale]